MKIGIINDVHMRGKAPIHRIDNFYETAMGKFKEALKIFKKEKCCLILDAGDLLHSPIVSLPICDDMIDAIDKNKIDYYTIFGNHPMLNAHIENSKATTLSHMFKRSKCLKYLTVLSYLDALKGNIHIQGYEYYHGIEDDIKKDGLTCVLNKNEATRIAVVHAMITENNMDFGKILQIAYKDLKTNYDYIIVGHNHCEIGIQKVGNTTIIGLGSIVRLTAAEKDYTRKPKVAILDTETKDIKVIELTSKPYEEVFNLELIAQKKTQEANLDIFVNSLKDTKLQSLDTVGIIKEIAKTEKVDKSVVDAIIKKIGELENEK